MLRRFLPLSLIFIVVGLATSFVGPYLALFLADGLHAGPVATTVFLTVAPISGVVVSWLIGRVSDRRPIRRQLLIGAALAGAAGTALTALFQNYWAVLAVTVTLTAVAGALFPQSFAYARQVLQQGEPGRAAFGISALRTVFSAAWVGGPPIAAVVLAAHGFGWTYGLAAALYLVGALLIVGWLPRVPQPAVGVAEVETRGTATVRPRTLLLIIASFTAVTTASTLNVQAMPLFVSDDLGGSIRQAGLVLGVCAAVEIPMMLALGALTTRIPVRRLIFVGVACGVAYHTIVVVTTSVWVLIAAQVLQAMVISSVGALSIAYVQDMMPDHPGRATTMVTNTFPISQIIAAPLFGLAQHFGFRLAYGMNLALCVVGLLLLLASGRRKWTAPRPAADQFSGAEPAYRP
ncbi:sugar efflux transporter [Paractinoplanes ferrugineus]|uniref:Sugar efflux transporter SetB n=1 Tax=Paractinoplanes ferrugineus TaxID=113564 RepID=A0A919J1J5_9ACTN|nr:sugar efflux transporter [Actinoplanes ferrugineus]GIE11692.1 sugar efflux transporter SetB [Actinoplanes ferrugineus]